MDTTLLRKAGLTESQAKGYLALIEHGALTPVELAEKTDESRTNGYMIADKLVALGLATKKEGKKALYTANHPSTLEVLAEKRRKVVERDEQTVKNGMASLINHFYKYQATPGVEVHYGGEGIETIRERTLKTGQELLFVRSPSDTGYDHEKMTRFIQARVAAGIKAQSIASVQDSKSSSREQLEAWLLDRTLLPGGWYDAPIEIDIFGDTVAFVDFDNDSMSTMVTSKNIAKAMRQLFLIAKQTSDQLYDQGKMLEQVKSGASAQTPDQAA